MRYIKRIKYIFVIFTLNLGDFVANLTIGMRKGTRSPELF